MKKFSFFCITLCSMIQAGAIEPHLTPEKLVGSWFPKDTFGDIKVALIGYCPPPKILSRYNPTDTKDQYFIHVAPSSVKICEHNGIKFLSLYHVYGGPVSAATVEELGYYGIEYILSYGFGGGLGTKGQKIGDYYLVKTSYPADGTTRHYTDEPLQYADQWLCEKIFAHTPFQESMQAMQSLQASTMDAIYREYEDELQELLTLGCDVLNCDTSHLYAAADCYGIKAVQCAVITDVIESDNQLGDMLSESASATPLDKLDDIVELYVERVLPELK